MLDNKKVFNISNFGIAGTVIYIVFVVWVRWPFSLQTLRAISINELGDFLAGVFGPLMLLWLILGFMLQRKELSQNTAALQLQADELKKSVEQHKELVEVTKEQVQIDIKSHQLTEMESYRETHPNFSIIGVEMYRSGIPVDNTKEILCYRVKIRNDGSSASNVRVTSDPKIHESIIINNDGSSKVGIDYEQVVQLLAFGEKFYFDYKYEKGKAPSKLKLKINCLDSNSQPYMKSIDMELDEKFVYHIVGTAEVF